jgi:hypothetical protein
MSVLRVADEDYPDAATRHLGDAKALCAAFRHDGASYLLGYVVECCLKSVRLHDQAWQPALLAHDPQALSTARKAMMNSKLFGHKLYALMATAIGTTGARYLPDLPPSASIYKWSEARRYQRADPQAEDTADAWLHWASYVYDATIVQMTLDGAL